MSFLSSTATIDAILTKKGREKLSQGRFNPSKFALADDEIDYGLLSTEDGEAKILSTMILEASSLGNDFNTQLKYKLIVSDGQIIIPQISVEPSSARASIYDIFEIRLNTTDGGIDNSYSVVNNSSNVTINPYKAIVELNKQLYIASSGKSYQSILAQLNVLKGIYGRVIIPSLTGNITDNPVPNNPVTYVYPETYTTRRVGSDNSHKFFIFTTVPTSSPVQVNISGNNSGAVSNFTITRITTTLQSATATAE